MNTDLSKLLRDAANTFLAIAEAYEQDTQQVKERLTLVEHRTEENRGALKSAAEAIFSTLR